ncbi:MAG: hypothetical protein GF313_06690 [Caldithrix sp.]|nr:hypothetical protein [Caldithrix sp.]
MNVGQVNEGKRFFPFLNRVILHGRLDWSVRLRWIAVSGYFLATIILWWFTEFQLPYKQIWIILAVLGAINLIYYAINAIYKNISFVQELVFLHVHIITDILFLTLLIHFSGGIENPIYLFYIFHIVISSIVFHRPTPFIIATITIVLFGALVLLEFKTVIPHHCIFNQTLHGNLGAIIIFLLIFAVTVYFTAYIGTTFMHIYRESKRLIDAKNTQLIKADKQKTQFFHFASHELKAPIIAIKSTVDSVQESYKNCLDDRAQAMMYRAGQRAGQMLNIINELLSLSRSRTKILENQQQKIDIIALIREIIRNEIPAAEAKKIRVETEINSTPIYVRGKFEDYEKIFVNLINNAVRYTQDNGKVSIKTDVDVQNRFFVFQIVDNGIGIAEEDLEKIYNEFYRSENARKLIAFGTGLGLALVKQLIENCGGNISVSSKLNEGTTFRVVLPINDTERTANNEERNSI